MSMKKLLVAYDESKPTAGQGDFLVVVFESATPVFWGLRSHRTYTSGRVVFLGKQITQRDVFSKLVDSGRKIDSVDNTLKNLDDYLQQLESFKVGNVLAVATSGDDLGFQLMKIAEMPKLNVSKLP